MNTPDWYASSVQIDITPPVGVPLEGYGAREKPSCGIHDPLYAQLLLLRSASEQVLLISLDLLGIQLSLTEKIRAGIKDAIEVPAKAIMIACSHTHSGPAGFLPDLPGLRTHADEELKRILVRKLVGASIMAKETLQPVTLATASGRAHGIGTNRNNPELGPLDDELLILLVDGEGSEPISVVLNYGCHPTVLGHENLWISADFPGAARQALRSIYPETCFQFTNGAAGDVSTRFTRRDQSFAEVIRLGRILAGNTLDMMQKSERLENNSLKYRIKDLDLPIRSFPPPGELSARVERLEAEVQLQRESGTGHGEFRKIFTQWQGAVGQARMAESFKGTSAFHTQLQAFTLGNMAWIGIPGEPFTRTVLAIKEKSCFTPTVVVSYCNDELGYFPDAEAYEKETYEALISPFREDVAKVVEQEALKLLKEMQDA
jgi:hypothetical protein